MTQRGKTRRFAHINKAAAMLKEMGIEDVLLSLQNWESEYSRSGRASRPDRSEAMKRAHEAAAYDAWFYEQVDAAISEADDPATVWVRDDNVSTLAATSNNTRRNSRLNVQAPYVLCVHGFRTEVEGLCFCFKSPYRWEKWPHKKSGAFQLSFYSPKRRGYFRFKREKLHTEYEKFRIRHVEENQEIFRQN